MGDSESKLDGYRFALENAKKIAAEEAASYVSTQSTYKDGKYSDRIILMSSSVMSVKELDKSVKLENGVFIATVKIEANIDSDALKRNIQKLQEDDSKQKIINSLSLKNIEMNKKLLMLTEKLSSKKISELDRADILKERLVLLNSISTNSENARKAFKSGTILRIANDKEDEYLKLVSEFENYILKASNTKLRISDPQSVHKTKEGHYSMLVYVHVKLDELPDSLEKVFPKHTYGGELRYDYRPRYARPEVEEKFFDYAKNRLFSVELYINDNLYKSYPIFTPNPLSAKEVFTPRRIFYFKNIKLTEDEVKGDLSFSAKIRI